MNNNELVSICIPVFNGEKYVDQCLKMVLEQTYQNLEIIIIDDGSNDGTKEILKKYHKNSRVRIFEQMNLGPSAARNLGIKNSKGKYIYFCDIDDKIYQDAIEILYNETNKKETDFVIANTRWITPDHKIITTCNMLEKAIYEGKDDVQTLILEFSKDVKTHRNLWTVWNKLYKSSVIKKNGIVFDETTRAEEDIIFVIDYISHCKSVHMIENVLYEYDRGKSDGLSMSGDKEPFAYKKIANSFERAFSGGHSKELKNCYSELAIWSLYRQARAFYFAKSDERGRIWENMDKIIKDIVLQESIGYYTQKHKDNDPAIPKLIKEKNTNKIIECFIQTFELREYV